MYSPCDGLKFIRLSLQRQLAWNSPSLPGCSPGSSHIPTRTAPAWRVNYRQIPVNRPEVPLHSYSQDGAMRVQNVSDPVYAPNSNSGPQADEVPARLFGAQSVGRRGAQPPGVQRRRKSQERRPSPC